jgi:hypothetical protein
MIKIKFIKVVLQSINQLKFNSITVTIAIVTVTAVIINI